MITAATATTTVQSNEADFTSENTCFGSHWSRRLFPSDIMNPVVDQPVSTTSYSTKKLTLVTKHCHIICGCSAP
jgi:hypothetical protein